MNLREFLGAFDFGYEVVDGKEIELIDLQGANLGGIEQDRFEIDFNDPTSTVAAIIDRMDVYINDSVIDEFEEALAEREVDSSDMDLEKMVAKCRELDVTENVSYVLADTILHPEKVELFYNPTTYIGDDGKRYISFSPIDDVHHLGSFTSSEGNINLRATHEYSLRYNITDDVWEGDVISHGEWGDISSAEAVEVAKKAGLFDIARSLAGDHNDRPASLSDTAKDAREASSEMASDGMPTHHTPEL